MEDMIPELMSNIMVYLAKESALSLACTSKAWKAVYAKDYINTRADYLKECRKDNVVEWLNNWCDGVKVCEHMEKLGVFIAGDELARVLSISKNKKENSIRNTDILMAYIVSPATMPPMRWFEQQQFAQVMKSNLDPLLKSIFENTANTHEEFARGKELSCLNYNGLQLCIQRAGTTSSRQRLRVQIQIFVCQSINQFLNNQYFSQQQVAFDGRELLSRSNNALVEALDTHMMRLTMIDRNNLTCIQQNHKYLHQGNCYKFAISKYIPIRDAEDYMLHLCAGYIDGEGSYLRNENNWAIVNMVKDVCSAAGLKPPDYISTYVPKFPQ